MVMPSLKGTQKIYAQIFSHFHASLRSGNFIKINMSMLIQFSCIIHAFIEAYFTNIFNTIFKFHALTVGSL